MFRGKKTKIGIVITAIFAIIKMFGVDVPEGLMETLIDLSGVLGPIIMAFGIEDKIARLIKANGAK